MNSSVIGSAVRNGESERVTLVNVYFHKWLDEVAEHLDPRFEIVKIDESSDSRITGKQDMWDTLTANSLAHVLSASSTDRFVLMGYSFAALIAFEVGVELRKMNHDVAAVVVDYPSPEMFYRWSRRTYFRILRRMRRARNQPLKDSVPYLVQRARSLIRGMLGSLAVNLLKQVNRPVPAGMRGLVNTRPLLEDMLRPRYFDGNLLVFRATQQSSWRRSDEPLHDLGWSRHVGGEVRTQDVEGNHKTSVDAPGAKCIVERLNAFVFSDALAKEMLIAK
jgi:thioesterase domain-containing protein